MRVILLNLVHTGNLQFLTIFSNLAANEHGFFYLANLNCRPLRFFRNSSQLKVAE